MSVIVARPRRRPPPILACGKCLKRVDGGKRLKAALKAELKHVAGGSPGKPPRLVQTACLGLCPRRAAVLASAETLSRGEYLLVGDVAAIPEAVRRLCPGQS